MKESSRIVIFTDLDGTLLDAGSYSFERALPALRMVADQEVPIVICSSKTRTEIEHYRRRLGNRHPFISENGGGIFIPNEYFPTPVQGIGAPIARSGGYTMIRLGAPYDELRRALLLLREEGFSLRGFGDMDTEEIGQHTGLSIAEAEMARQREFDEPFFAEGDLSDLILRIREMGYHHTVGRIHHILGPSDKGKAVKILTGLFRRDFGDIRTVALGDSPNDLPMLRSVDIPIIVEQPGGGYDAAFEHDNLLKAPGIGPEGWNQAVLELLTKNG